MLEMGNNQLKTQGLATLVKCLQVQCSGGILRYLFQSEGLLEFVVCFFDLFNKKSKRLSVLNEDQSKIMLCDMSRLPYELICHWGLMIQ